MSFNKVAGTVVLLGLFLVLAAYVADGLRGARASPAVAAVFTGDAGSDGDDRGLGQILVDTDAGEPLPVQFNQGGQAQLSVSWTAKTVTITKAGRAAGWRCLRQ